MLELKIHDTESRPTIFHVTQPKCASQWVAEILKWCAYRRVVVPLSESKHFTDPTVRLVQGLIYPTLYITSEEFVRVISKAPHIKNYHVILVIRDLRDLLISQYFSIKNSHASGDKYVDKDRALMKEMDLENGLLFLMQNSIVLHAAIASSWLKADLDIRFKRYSYESLVENDNRMITDVLKYCEIDVPPEQFKLVMSNNRFEKLAGRKRGVEDVNHHYRKGVAGDWVNYFTPRVKDEFKEKFNDVLVLAGYEDGDSW